MLQDIREYIQWSIELCEGMPRTRDRIEELREVLNKINGGSTMNEEELKNYLQDRMAAIRNNNGKFTDREDELMRLWNQFFEPKLSQWE